MAEMSSAVFLNMSFDSESWAENVFDKTLLRVFFNPLSKTFSALYEITCSLNSVQPYLTPHFRP